MMSSRLLKKRSGVQHALIVLRESAASDGGDRT